MAKKKTKLELTWLGKEHHSKLEPRILIEDPATLSVFLAETHSARAKKTKMDFKDLN